MAMIAFAAAKADSGINSPYSRYGMGILSNQSLGINRQMGGLGYGLRSSEYINILNPASFSQADTLTMLFEAGFSLQEIKEIITCKKSIILYNNLAELQSNPARKLYQS